MDRRRFSPSVNEFPAILPLPCLSKSMGMEYSSATPPDINRVREKLYLRSFGCQMNDYDSNRIVDLLGEAMQLEKTDDLNEADLSSILAQSEKRLRRRFSPI